MKQLLFLLLFPAFALAQYPGNAGQKITLGEQTTADGLVYRGLAADTTRKPSVDTMAYILLDTNTNIIWQYKKATSNAWTRVGGSISSGLTGVLPVENGGTGATSFVAANRLIYSSSATQLTNSADFTISNSGDKFIEVKSSENNRVAYLKATNNTPKSFEYGVWGTTTSTFGAINADDGYLYGTTNMSFVTANNSGIIKFGIGTSGTERMRLTTTGLGIGTTPAVQFHTTGGVRFATFAGGGTTTLSVDNNGDLARTSSFELKKDVTPINYGLNEILQINPINFNWIDGDKFGNENENGFIAEDVMSIIPNVVGSDAHGLFMDYTKLIPILTKAIQEQQALIKALEQRIINLENK